MNFFGTSRNACQRAACEEVVNVRYLRVGQGTIFTHGSSNVTLVITDLDARSWDDAGTWYVSQVAAIEHWLEVIHGESVSVSPPQQLKAGTDG